MRYCVLILGLCLLLPACSGDDPTAPEPVPSGTVDAILAAAGKVQTVGPEADNITNTEETDGDYRVTYEQHDAIENLENVTCLGLNDDVIWPGSLVRGDQAYSYVYEPIMVPRSPVMLSISLDGENLSEVVAAPSLSTVRQGISNLVGRALDTGSTAPAQIDWSYQQVYSESQMSLFVDADIAYGSGSLAASFDWSESSTTNKIMAKYTQIYYSVDMDTPASPSAVLGSGMTEAEMRAAFPTGSQPLYVAGVKYGLMAIMCIETSFTMSQMSLALDAAYDGVVDVDLGFGYTAQEVMQASSIRIIVYGGSTSGIDELNGFDGFMNIISHSTTFGEDSPGVPILYKFRHLRDNTLAMISLTSQYTIVHQLRIRQGVRVTCQDFFCEWSYDDDPFYDADVDMDRFKLLCNAWNRTGAGDPGIQINPVDQAVFDWSTPDYYEMSSGTDFTAGGSIDLVFDTDNFDFNYAKIQLKAYGRDYDWASGNEDAWGTLEILGSSMYGAKTVMIYGSDFRFRVNVNISPIQ